MSRKIGLLRFTSRIVENRAKSITYFTENIPFRFTEMMKICSVKMAENIQYLTAAALLFGLNRE
jgi:hypothetical protein